MNTGSAFSTTMSKPDARLTDVIRRRYQRIAPYYDRMEKLAERCYHPWRLNLWEKVRGPRVLEVGVGTGKNMPFYPAGVSVTGIDLTPGMLQCAQKRAGELGLNSSANLHLGDVQELDFSDAAFDSAVATFVFCSVPDPVLGLRELKRVVSPGGRVLLLEHVRSSNHMVGKLMDLLNPLVVRTMGANINRRTVENVRHSGLEVESVEDLGLGGIFKLIIGRVDS